MRFGRPRTRLVAGAAVLFVVGLAFPVAAAAATSHLIVAATQPPAALPPGYTGTSTVTLFNSGVYTRSGVKVTITLPAVVSGAPTVTLAPAPGVTCQPRKAAPLVQVCTVSTLGPKVIATVATLTGTPPANIGSGVTTSVTVAGPANTVAVDWSWGLPLCR